jgi:hypothetical protein
MEEVGMRRKSSESTKVRMKNVRPLSAHKVQIKYSCSYMPRMYFSKERKVQ